MPATGLSPLASTLSTHLRDTLDPAQYAPADPLYDAGTAVVSILPTYPEAVRELAYTKFYAYPFKDVPACWRRAYEEACLWEVALGLEQAVEDDQGDGRSEALRRCMDRAVKLCDWAIIFTGTPARRALVDAVLGMIESALENNLKQAQRGTKRRRAQSEDGTSDGEEDLSYDGDVSSFPATNKSRIMPAVRQECAISRIHCPSLDGFEKHMRTVRTPAIIAHSIDHWPALKLWQRPGYWRRRTLGGRRLVPVELGRSYTDESWGQRIMPFKEFMENYLLVNAERSVFDNACGIGDSDGDGAKDQWQETQLVDGPGGPTISPKISHDLQPPTGYLAQHDLLTQIPALRNDIAVPDYCYLETPSHNSAPNDHDANAKPTSTDNGDEDIGSEHGSPPPSSPLLNIWLGPANTVSPAHTDPHHNILAQIVGSKYVRLFAPSQADRMYPMDRGDAGLGVNMQNTSRVDVSAFVDLNNTVDSESGAGRKKSEEDEAAAAQREKFPEHSRAAFLEGIVHAGECLYIPRGWWHYVRSLEPSCSVSFWWD